MLVAMADLDNQLSFSNPGQDALLVWLEPWAEEFNHLQPHFLSGDPASEGGKRVLFYSGDDTNAKAGVGALIDRLGFAGIDLGWLAIGGRLVHFPSGPLPARNLVKFG